MTAKKKTAAKTAKTAKKTASKAAPKTKKTTAAKTVAKKKASPKKATSKTAASKKSTASTKASSRKKTAKKAAPAKKASRKKASAKKAAADEASSKENKPNAAAEEVTRRVTEALRNKKGGRKAEEENARKGQPVVFSMADVREYLAERKTAPEEPKVSPKKSAPASPKPAETAKPSAAPARPKQSFGAASVADLLGFDPTADSGADTASKTSEEGIPKKWLPYFRALVTLHEEVYEGLHRHSEETLRRSNKEDSGDLSSYGQHMADAGTDSFDRDFALSMVSSEQEALYEIDEAIRRIREGTYGVCEITGKSISRDRLRAVPFTRYSVEGQMEVEKGKKRTVQKAGIQGFDGDDGPVLTDDDSDD